MTEPLTIEEVLANIRAKSITNLDSTIEPETLFHRIMFLLEFFTTKEKQCQQPHQQYLKHQN